MNAIPIGILAQSLGASGLNYWIEIVNQGIPAITTIDFSSGIVEGTSGAIVLVGTGDSSQFGYSYDFAMTKLRSDGTVEWTQLNGDSRTNQLKGVSRSSEGASFFGAGESNGLEFYTVRRDTANNKVWDKVINFGSGVNVTATKVATGADNNPVFSGSGFLSSSNTTSQTYAVKMANLDGSLTWQRRIGTTTQATQGKAVASDSSSNVFIAGETSTLTNGTGGFLIKYSSTGVLQFQRALNNVASGDLNTFDAVAVDQSNGDVYCAGYLSSGSAFDALLAKYDNTGTLQWTLNTGLSNSTVDRFFGVVAKDGVVYAVGNTGSSPNQQMFIAKYNSTGSLLWQRSLGVSGLTDIGWSIALTSDGNLLIAGQLNISGSDYATIVARLPSDGSLTGTYTLGSYTVTYLATSYNSGSTTLSGVSTSLTGATPTGTANDFTSTSNSQPSITLTKVSI